MARRFCIPLKVSLPQQGGQGRVFYPFGLKRDGVKEVKEVSASLEVKDDTLAGDTIGRTNFDNFDNSDNFDNFEKTYI